MRIPFANGRIRPALFGDSCAHSVRMLRMPYSLNEDTGLVSLPIPRDALSLFRPWQAHPEVVSVTDEWPVGGTDEERGIVNDFLQSLRRCEPIPRRAYFDTIGEWAQLAKQAQALPKARATPATTTCSAVRARAWEQLRGKIPVDAADVRAATQQSDPDTRWLTTEAFFLHGTQPDSEMIGLLASDHDVYAQPSLLDTMARFPDCTRQFAIDVMRSPSLSHQARALTILAQYDLLQGGILEALSGTPVECGTLALRLACVTGTGTRDWPATRKIIERETPRYRHEMDWDTRVAALTHLEAFHHQWWRPGIMPTARALSELGPAIVDLLLLAMGSSDRRVRLVVIIALAEIGDSRALDILVEALPGKYRDTSRWAIRGLLNLGSVAIPALLSAAASDDDRLRRYAIRCLGHMPPPAPENVITTLRTALQDADDRVCLQAAIALGKTGSAGDVPRLAEIVRERDCDSAQRAVAALAALGQPGQDALATLAFENGEPTAAGQLLQQGNEQARVVLLKALEGPESKRTPAVLELARGPVDDSLVPVFSRFLEESSDWRRIRLIDVLSRVPTPQVLDVLLGQTRHQLSHHRRLAAEALGHRPEPEAITALVRLLCDKNTKVRTAAQHSLLAHEKEGERALRQAVEERVNRRGAEKLKQSLRAFELRRRVASGSPVDDDLIRLTHASTCGEETLAAALRERARSQDVHELIALLRHDVRTTRWHCMRLLSTLGNVSMAPLEAFLATDPGEPARETAEEALEKLRNAAEE